MDIYHLKFMTNIMLDEFFGFFSLYEFYLNNSYNKDSFSEKTVDYIPNYTNLGGVIDSFIYHNIDMTFADNFIPAGGIKSSAMHLFLHMADFIINLFPLGLIQTEEDIHLRNKQAETVLYLNILLESFAFNPFSTHMDLQDSVLFRDFVLQNHAFIVLKQIQYNFFFFQDHSTLFVRDMFFSEYIQTSVFQK